jgi:phosphate transport system substrate-binding protein
VAKDLAKQIVKHLPEGLRQAETPLPSFTPSEQPDALTGAGATFPYPVYQKWFTNFQAVNPASHIVYDAVGSEAGIQKLLSGAADFGASDNPEILHQLAPDSESSYLLFPSVVGAVVPIVNLPGFTANISLTPEALAGIYLGRIKRWNDPILREANKGIDLPNLDIVVVHRSDGSGTSYTWTDYLSKTNPDWKTQIGASLDPKWPLGRAATGNDGVAKLVKELGGSIGYVEFIYALQNHLNFTKVRNRRGEFVSADLASIAAAADSVVMGADFKTSITDAPDAGAWPISSFTWLVVPAHISDEAKRSNMTAFLKWMLGTGQRQAAALGYLALPSNVVSKEEAAISRIH